MKFGRQLLNTQRKIFRYRDIADLSYGGNGGHFTKWPKIGITLHTIHTDTVQSRFIMTRNVFNDINIVMCFHLVKHKRCPEFYTCPQSPPQ